MGLYSAGRTLASLWYDNKKKQLQGEGRPETKVDSGGSKNRNYFSDQEITESELRELKEIRESGGVVAHLVRAKALMQFGTGVEIETENPELEEWILEYFPDLDNLFIELGEDAIWFPAAYGEIVETRGGDFSHLEAVEPWTILPIEDPYGEVVAWEQKIEGEREGEILQKDELVHFPVHKASARDKTGISDVLCAKEEIEQYRANQHAISNAVEMAAFPHNHWRVGSDQMSTITDNELRRVRNIVDDLKSDTQIITGPDVEHKRIEPTKFDFTELTNHDLRKLAIALGVPMDLVSVGEHGLGAGEESKIRMQMFERQARAAQRTLTGQFKSKVLEPVLRDYSPFIPTEEEFDIHLGDPIEEDETKEMINAIGDDLTVNERRELFDKAELEDEEIGEGFQSAADQEAPEDAGGGLPGMFEDAASSALENLELSEAQLEQYPEWERSLMELHSRVHHEGTDRQLLEFNESETPQFVKDRLRDAILAGEVFSDIESIPSGERMQLQEYLLESLQSDNWSIDGIADQIEQLGATPQEAETIARTEVGHIVNEAREEGYEEQGLVEGETFYWTGSTDDRTTDTCKYLIKGTNADLDNPSAFSGLPRSDGTNPFEGGEPMELDELKDHITNVANADPAFDTQPRTFTPHIQCRKSYTRYVEG